MVEAPISNISVRPDHFPKNVNLRHHHQVSVPMCCCNLDGFDQLYRSLFFILAKNDGQKNHENHLNGKY